MRELDYFYDQTLKQLESEVFLIAMTIQGWSYSEIMAMPEDVRARYVQRCEEHQERIQDDIEAAKRGRG